MSSKCLRTNKRTNDDDDTKPARRPIPEQLALRAFSSPFIVHFLSTDELQSPNMRLLSTFLSLALLGAAPSALAAAGASKKTAEERFQLYHSKALSSAPVKLADASYRELTSTPRDYAVAVLLTAMDPRYGCQLCREFQPEWDLLARSWTSGDKKGLSRIVYGTLDFSDGRDIFMSVSTELLRTSFRGPLSCFEDCVWLTVLGWHS